MNSYMFFKFSSYIPSSLNWRKSHPSVLAQADDFKYQKSNTLRQKGTLLAHVMGVASGSTGSRGSTCHNCSLSLSLSLPLSEFFLWLKFSFSPHVQVTSLQLCPTLWDPMDCCPPGSSVHGILQARILEWFVMPFSTGSSPPRDGTHLSCISCGFFTTEPPGEAPQFVSIWS